MSMIINGGVVYGYNTLTEFPKTDELRSQEDSGNMTPGTQAFRSWIHPIARAKGKVSECLEKKARERTRKAST